MSSTLDAGRFGSGQAVHRIEDPALLAGAGRFTDDVNVAGQTYMAFLRSPYAHARIGAVDAAAARAAPGVLAVYTGAELAAAGVAPIPSIDVFKRADGKVLVTPARRALAHEVVRFVGEAVAAVVATSREAARDACELVAVDYDELPAVVSAPAAIVPGAAVIAADAPDNIAAEMRHGDAAATAAAFARATHVVALDLVNQRVAPSAIEPRSVLAEFDAA
ncbi:MAG: molybdopterin cofactor-binding domain-containing protein, partial [Caldimonas sp.]